MLPPPSRSFNILKTQPVLAKGDSFLLNLAPSLTWHHICGHHCNFSHRQGAQVQQAGPYPSSPGCRTGEMEYMGY